MTHNVEYLKSRLLKARRSLAGAHAAYQYFHERVVKLTQDIEAETLKQGLMPDVEFAQVKGPPGGEGPTVKMR